MSGKVNISFVPVDQSKAVKIEFRIYTNSRMKKEILICLNNDMECINEIEIERYICDNYRIEYFECINKDPSITSSGSLKIEEIDHYIDFGEDCYDDYYTNLIVTGFLWIYLFC